MTPLSLITRALRTIGAKEAGEVLSAAEAQDGLQSANGMLDAWNAMPLALFVVESHDYPLVADQQTYTIGEGGDFDQRRPTSITYASIISYQNPQQPLEIFIPILSTQQWQQVPTKDVGSSLPVYVYYEPTFPLAKLKYYPIPNGQQTLETRLYIPTQLERFETLTTNYTFPPGYEEALVYNLAKRLAPEYGRPLDPVLAQMALESLMVMKRANIIEVDLVLDPALLTRRWYFNWKTGSPV